MSEFDLIRQHFTRATHHTQLSVGDDAALISLTQGMELAISADMLVAGTHFFADCDPYNLGWKSLAVNVSDMAAMGANPKWATLAIALPEVNEPWLAEFSRGFFVCAETFNIDLIGGDTTRGPLNICVQIMGEVPTGLAIKRSGAKLGDEIWVSGTLGAAALALAHLQGKLTLPEDTFANCAKALHAPQPRVTLGLALRGIANSAIDISDGLLADLGHILEASKVGANIFLNQLPVSSAVYKSLNRDYLLAAISPPLYRGRAREGVETRIFHHSTPILPFPLQGGRDWLGSPGLSGLNLERVQSMVLAGGDDYELCFTAPVEKHAEITRLSKTLNLALSTIGCITANTGLVLHGFNDEILDIKETGFDHFS